VAFIRPLADGLVIGRWGSLDPHAENYQINGVTDLRLQIRRDTRIPYAPSQMAKQVQPTIITDPNKLF